MGILEMLKEPDQREPTANEYLDEDGLLHCKVCGGKKQTIVTFQGHDIKVRCICKCREEELEAEKQEEKKREIEKKRDFCFQGANMKHWSFENDDKSNPKLSDAMKRYADGFQEFRKDGKGLLLFGTVGTGKTYYAACIANDLIDKGYSVLMTNFSQLINSVSGMYEGKEEYIRDLNRYSLLIIDDLGIERKTEYVQELVFNIIDSRYRSGLPFIITTNLTAEELKRTDNIGYSRIYDRIMERCFPVKVEGKSRRKQELRNSFEDMKAKLGL